MYNCNPHPLQAIAILDLVDEDDLTWVANETKYILIIEQFHENVCSRKPIDRCRKSGHSSEMQNGVLLHREGLNG